MTYHLLQELIHRLAQPAESFIADVTDADLADVVRAARGGLTRARSIVGPGRLPGDSRGDRRRRRRRLSPHP